MSVPLLLSSAFPHGWFQHCSRAVAHPSHIRPLAVKPPVQSTVPEDTGGPAASGTPTLLGLRLCPDSAGSFRTRTFVPNQPGPSGPGSLVRAADAGSWPEVRGLKATAQRGNAGCHWQLACQCKVRSPKTLADQPPVAPRRARVHSVLVLLPDTLGVPCNLPGAPPICITFSSRQTKPTIRWPTKQPRAGDHMRIAPPAFVALISQMQCA